MTAQLIQTFQGPRISLQGIQESQLEQEQLVALRQQIMQQMKKQQAQASQQGEVPPTKMTLHLERNRQKDSAALDQQNPDQLPPKKQ